MTVGGVQMGIGSLWYQSSVYAPKHAATTAPVEPVKSTPSVEQGSKAKVLSPATIPEAKMPEIRQGADPVEMQVRSRIQYLDPGEISELMRKQKPSDGLEDPAAKIAEAAAAKNDSPVEKATEDVECQTCENRKYQDGSNDPGVSFKTPTKLNPAEAATAVRGHEMEHVSRNQAEAAREDRKVVMQSVTLKGGICPECGDPYIAGGETRTVTKANPAEEEVAAQNQQNQQNQPTAVFGFEATA